MSEPHNHIGPHLADIIAQAIHEHGLDIGRTWTETDRDGITERRLITIHAYARDLEIRVRRTRPDELTITAHSGDRLTGLVTIDPTQPDERLHARIGEAIHAITPDRNDENDQIDGNNRTDGPAVADEPLTSFRWSCGGRDVEWAPDGHGGSICRQCGRHPSDAHHDVRYEYAGARRYRLEPVGRDESYELDPKLAWQWERGVVKATTVAERLGVTARPETLRINIR